MIKVLCRPKMPFGNFVSIVVLAGPGDDYISFHILGVGSWTKGLYSLCERKIHAAAAVDEKQDLEEIDLEDGLHEVGPSLASSLQVNVDGPFGAPAQDHSSYSSLLLVVSRQPIHAVFSFQSPAFHSTVVFHRDFQRC